MTEVLVRARYSPKHKLFDLEIGPSFLEVEPVQFGRMIEYLETVWESYSKRRRK